MIDPVNAIRRQITNPSFSDSKAHTCFITWCCFPLRCVKDKLAFHFYIGPRAYSNNNDLLTQIYKPAFIPKQGLRDYCLFQNALCGKESKSWETKKQQRLDLTGGIQAEDRKTTPVLLHVHLDIKCVTGWVFFTGLSALLHLCFSLVCSEGLRKDIPLDEELS